MDLTDLVKNKKPGAIDPKRRDVKMGLLKEISDMAGQSMGDDVRGIKKVSVAAPDKAGLAEGLDTAKDLIDGDSDAEDKAEDGPAGGHNPDTFSEHPRATRLIEKEIDDEELTPEEIDELIAQLQAKKDTLP
jgi:hypothetical protein